MTVWFLLKFIGGFCLLRFVFLLFVTATPLLDFIFFFPQHINNDLKNGLYERVVLSGYQFLVNFPNYLNHMWQHGKTLFIYMPSERSLCFISSVFKILLDIDNYCCCLDLRVTNRKRKQSSQNDLCFEKIWEDNQTLKTRYVKYIAIHDSLVCAKCWLQGIYW